MTRERNDPSREPSPEQLAALVDGQLPQREREQVEAWLDGHPESAATVAAWRRLAQLWQQTAAPEPSAAAWDSTLARVEAILPPLPRKSATPSSWRLSLVLGVAAAVFVAFLLARSFWSVKVEEEGPFLVATAQDVTILSMDADDTDALVVAQPPIMDQHLPLAEHGDIKWIGRMPPRIRLEEGKAPMIVDPLARADWEEEKDD